MAGEWIWRLGNRQTSMAEKKYGGGELGDRNY